MARTKTARQRRILAELDQHAALRIGELATRLGVSGETVRRDLDDLDRQGLIGRTYGGAVRHRPSEPSLNERHGLLVAEREAIARSAVPLMAGAGHVLIGSGATTAHVARRMGVELNGLTVVTHSFAVATVLSFNPTIPVMMTPGFYHAGEGAMTGAATTAFLDRFRADWAVLGASGLTEDGPSDALIEPAEVFAAMLSRAERRMIVADASKFARVFPARWADWSEIDCLVTDRAPEGGLAAALERAGVAVIVAARPALAEGPA